jgi:DNA polymerase-3 subunit alpha
VLYPEKFKECGHLVETDTMVLVRGKFERDEETARIVASSIEPVAELRGKLAREVVVRLASPRHGRQTFEALVDVFARHRGDRRVTLRLDVSSTSGPMCVIADAPLRVRPSERLVSDVELICGAGSVQLR